MKELKNELKKIKEELNRITMIDTPTMIDKICWLEKLIEDNDFNKKMEMTSERTCLREQYLIKFNKKPFPGWNVDDLKKKLAEQKEEIKLKPSSLRSKKAKWKKKK